MKQLVKNYTFDPGTGKITFTDFTAISLDRVLLVTNVTANVIIYQFNTPSLGGSASGKVLTLTASTSSMNSADHLQIIYDAATGDPVYDTPVVQGNIASGATDSGNPVKIGGVYSAVAPTYTNGQRGDVQIDTAGRLLTNTAPLSATVDSIALSDGSNSASVLANAAAVTTAQTGQSALLVSPTGASTATITLTSTSQASSWYDLLNYPWVSVEVLSNVSAATLTFQTSGDSAQTIISSMGLYSTTATVGNGVNTTTVTSGNFQGPRAGRYFRINSNLSTGNTASVVITFYTAGSFPNTLGVVAAQNGSWNVGASSATGSAIPANAFYVAGSNGSNLTGLQLDAGSNLKVSLNTSTSGGWTPSVQAALSNTVQDIKIGAGTLGGLDLFNPNSTPAYIQFFNAAAANVTLGTTAPFFVKALPGTASGSAANINWGAGIAFSTAISWAATGGKADNSSPGAAVTGLALYK